jgi:hypothetical protein
VENAPVRQRPTASATSRLEICFIPNQSQNTLGAITGPPAVIASASTKLIIPRVLPCGFWGNNGNAFFLMFPGPFGPQSSEFMKLSGSASVLSLCCPATAPILWAFQYAAILGHIISHRVPAFVWHAGVSGADYPIDRNLLRAQRLCRGGWSCADKRSSTHALS